MGSHKNKIRSVITIEIIPPITIVLDAPITPAQKPTQIVPILFDVWAATYINEKALPRILSGVVSITVVTLTATVTESAAPNNAIKIIPVINELVKPKANKKSP